jgi:hypothetical protein
VVQCRSDVKEVKEEGKGTEGDTRKPPPSQSSEGNSVVGTATSRRSAAATGNSINVRTQGSPAMRNPPEERNQAAGNSLVYAAAARTAAGTTGNNIGVGPQGPPAVAGRPPEERKQKEADHDDDKDSLFSTDGDDDDSSDSDDNHGDDDEDEDDFYGREDQDDEELNTTTYSAFVLAKTKRLLENIPNWAYTATKVGVRNLERNISFMKLIDGLISFQTSEYVFLTYILENGSIEATWYVVSTASQSGFYEHVYSYFFTMFFVAH